MAICFFINWIVDFGITRATPNMITEMGWGVFLLYAMLTYLGVIFIFFCLPEMKGRSIESMDNLFDRPLWMMWRHAYPTEEEKVRSDVRDEAVMGKLQDDDDTKRNHVEHVETAWFTTECGVSAPSYANLFLLCLLAPKTQSQQGARSRRWSDPVDRRGKSFGPQRVSLRLTVVPR